MSHHHGHHNHHGHGHHGHHGLVHDILFGHHDHHHHRPPPVVAPTIQIGYPVVQPVFPVVQPTFPVQPVIQPVITVPTWNTGVKPANATHQCNVNVFPGEKYRNPYM